jgi:hypothetical protein
MLKFLSLGLVLAAATFGSGLLFLLQHEDGAGATSGSSAGGAAHVLP